MEEIQRGSMPPIKEMIEELEVKKEQFVKDKVTFTIVQKVGVEMRKPWWMPNSVYRWLWRTVILTEEEHPLFTVDQQ